MQAAGPPPGRGPRARSLLDRIPGLLSQVGLASIGSPLIKENPASSTPPSPTTTRSLKPESSLSQTRPLDTPQNVNPNGPPAPSLPRPSSNPPSNSPQNPPPSVPSNLPVASSPNPPSIPPVTPSPTSPTNASPTPSGNRPSTPSSTSPSSTNLICPWSMQGQRLLPKNTTSSFKTLAMGWKAWCDQESKSDAECQPTMNVLTGLSLNNYVLQGCIAISMNPENLVWLCHDAIYKQASAGPFPNSPLPQLCMNQGNFKDRCTSTSPMADQVLNSDNQKLLGPYLHGCISDAKTMQCAWLITSTLSAAPITLNSLAYYRTCALRPLSLTSLANGASSLVTFPLTRDTSVNTSANKDSGIDAQTLSMTIAGGVFGLLLILSGVFFYRKRKRQAMQNEENQIKPIPDPLPSFVASTISTSFPTPSTPLPPSIKPREPSPLSINPTALPPPFIPSLIMPSTPLPSLPSTTSSMVSTPSPSVSMSTTPSTLVPGVGTGTALMSSPTSPVSTVRPFQVQTPLPTESTVTTTNSTTHTLTYLLPLENDSNMDSFMTVTSMPPLPTLLSTPPTLPILHPRHSVLSSFEVPLSDRRTLLATVLSPSLESVKTDGKPVKNIHF